MGQELGNGEGRVAGGILVMELENVFVETPEACDPSFQSREYLQVKGCICSLSLQYKLEMDDFSDIEEDNQDCFDERLAHARFFRHP